MDKLQLSQALMRSQRTTGGWQGGFAIRDTFLYRSAQRFDFRNSRVLYLSTAVCTVIRLKTEPVKVTSAPPTLDSESLIKGKCPISKSLMLRATLTQCLPLLRSACDPASPYISEADINYPSSPPCICSLLSRKKSWGVGVIQTFFKLQFIFPEL